MTPIAHLASGMWIYILSSNVYDVGDIKLLLVSMVGSLAPDIDGLFGNQMKDHRNTAFHAPLFWMLCFLVICLFLPVLGYDNALPYVFGFFVGTLVHLFLDWISARTSGVMLFYPFSKKLYSLFPTTPEKGAIDVMPNRSKEYKDFWKFYLENKLLVILEAIIIVSPLLLLSKLKS